MIKLADIPNAPQGLGANPRDVPLLGAGEVRQAFGSAARNMQRDTMSLDAFSGEGKGLAALGQGISTVGQAATAMAEKVLDAQIETQVMDAETAMAREYGEFSSSLQGTDPATWQQKWSERMRPFRERVAADKALSPVAKQRIGQQMSRWEARTAIQIAGQAAQETFSRRTQAFKQQYDEKLATRDYAGARQIAKEAGEKQIIYPEQSEGLQRRVDRVQSYDGLAGIAEDAPKDALVLLKDERATSGLTTDQIDELHAKAERNIQKKRRDALETMSQMIRVNGPGAALTEEQIRGLGGGYITDLDVKEVMLEQRAAFSILPPDPKAYSSLRTEVAKYDPDQDKNGEKWQSLRQGAMQLPAHWRDGVLADLERRDPWQDRRQQSPNAGVRTDIFQRIDELGKMGMFGEVDKKGDPKDTASRDSIYHRSLGFKDDFERWLKVNPGATREQADAWLGSQIRTLKTPGITPIIPESSRTRNAPPAKKKEPDKAREILKRAPIPQPDMPSSDTLGVPDGDLFPIPE